MNKSRIVAIILAVAAVVLLAMGIYGATRPISYGASYYNASYYEGEEFRGTMVFYTDNTMVIRNTNYDEEYKSYYYCKNGYVFFSLAQTEAEYQEEVAAIDADFEGAVNTPFYASKVNAFKLTSEGLDDYATTYTCKPAIFMAIAGGVVELILIVFTIVSFATPKKNKVQ